MRIGTDKSASVYECVRSCRYSVSSECHLMETGHRMNWLVVVLPEDRSLIVGVSAMGKLPRCPGECQNCLWSVATSQVSFAEWSIC